MRLMPVPYMWWFIMDCIAFMIIGVACAVTWFATIKKGDKYLVAYIPILAIFFLALLLRMGLLEAMMEYF